MAYKYLFLHRLVLYLTIHRKGESRLHSLTADFPLSYHPDNFSQFITHDE